MNRTKSTFTGCVLGLGLLLAAGQPAQAAISTWDNSWTPSGWTRGATPGTHYAEYNVWADTHPLTPGVQDNTPDVSVFGSGNYLVNETTGTGFITGTQNIYSFSGTGMKFDFTAGNLGGDPGLVRDVHLRVAGFGNYDPTLHGGLGGNFINFTLNGAPGTYQQLFNAETGSSFGTVREVEGVYSWLGASNAGPFTLQWDGFASHIGLDQVSLDVGAPVPVPAAVYLMGSGLAGIAAMARRKQKSA